MDELLQREWRNAADSPVVGAALRALYAEIEAATEVRRPRCDKSGRCCHFEKFGHRMYVTGLEVAAFLHSLGRPVSAAELSRGEEDGTCPFLVDGLCSVHEFRPMGCRIFFCDPSAQEWQNELYERSHQRIAVLHEEHDIPYRYGEWRQMLGAAGDDRSRNSSVPSPPASSTRFVHVRIER